MGSINYIREVIANTVVAIGGETQVEHILQTITYVFDYIHFQCISFFFILD